MVGGAFCLTPYAHGYDLAPLVPLAAAWLFERRAHGWGLAAAGGALLAGLVASPTAACAFFGALALIQSPWRRLVPAATRLAPGALPPAERAGG
jgi:hypothetical protein